MKRAGGWIDQSLPCQNSLLSRPTKPSIAALSGLQPLADMLLARLCPSQIEIRPGQRYGKVSNSIVKLSGKV